MTYGRRDLSRSSALHVTSEAVESCHGLEDVCRSSLTGAGRDDVEDHGVLVSLAERFEDLGRSRVCGQGDSEIGWNGRFLLRLVSRVPPSISLGGLDLGEAGRAHPPGRHERLHPADVHLRPSSSRSTSNVVLQEVHIVICLPLARDPAIAQAKVDGLVVSQGRNARPLLCDLQPNSGPPVDIAYQPRFELGGVPECDHLGRACIPLRRHISTLTWRPDSRGRASGSQHRRITASRYRRRRIPSSCDVVTKKGFLCSGVSARLTCGPTTCRRQSAGTPSYSGPNPTSAARRPGGDPATSNSESVTTRPSSASSTGASRRLGLGLHLAEPSSTGTSMTCPSPSSELCPPAPRSSRRSLSAAQASSQPQ